MLVHEKILLADGAIAELLIWQLVRPAAERPHGLKYRLYFGRGGKSLVRYDNESGKGDRRYVMDREEHTLAIAETRAHIGF